ncbi:hypothetical protein [Candidatus Leptofilum sp.]|uniref:hypothetical protein n=1 Tax=Candidatus Leptofilum sp. TaxID=3241576 RepID=UPI003B591D14
MKIQLLIISSIVSLLFGCSSISTLPSTEEPINVDTEPLVTKTPERIVAQIAAETSVATPTVSSNSMISATLTPIAQSNIIEITMEHVIHFHWSLDGRTLIYQTPGQFWQYDLLSRETSELSNEFILSLTPSAPSLPSNLGMIDLLTFSPDGTTYLYLNSIEPTKTPSPDLGEQYLRGELSELWVNQKGDDVLIGEVNNCFNEVSWSQDGSSFILFPDIHANCISARGLHVDLETLTTQTIFPNEEYQSLISIRDFSDDGKRVLWSEEANGQLRIKELNLEDMQSVEIHLPENITDNLYNINWVGNFNNFIVFYANDDGDVISFFNADTFETTEIISYSDILPQNSFGGIFGFLLSQDQMWLAILTGTNVNDINGLFLVEINRITN